MSVPLTDELTGWLADELTGWLDDAPTNWLSTYQTCESPSDFHMYALVTFYRLTSFNSAAGWGYGYKEEEELEEQHQDESADSG
ncbi:GD17484 [Drosophila simulans]|uniref:GD17484 n=1 Tax=Drosophila simulans TaxID=7240 RepID=B4R2X6_DROSI|nr:GD17484 [Drosophila simulans]